MKVRKLPEPRKSEVLAFLHKFRDDWFYWRKRWGVDGGGKDEPTGGGGGTTTTMIGFPPPIGPYLLSLMKIVLPVISIS